MVFPIAGGTQDTSYEISNSLRFNDDDDPSLSRTPSSESNRKTWTWSGWVKRSNISIDIMLLSAGSAGQGVYLSSGNQFLLTKDGVGNYGSTALLRDVSAWYHLVVACDTTQTGMANIAKFYINGTEQSTSGTTIYSTNEDTNINDDVAHYISRWSGSSAENHHDGYLADVNFVDGLRLDASYFGETNDNGVWIPKQYTGLHGTNGFFLEFQQTGTSANSSGIGADTSGNDNHFTPTNLAATDVTVDTPTNNFATLNPLQTVTYPTLSEGNLVQTGHSSSDSAGIGATIMPASGKWYAEAKVPNISSATDGYPHFGITDTSLLSTRGTQGTKIAAGFKINDAASVTNTNILGTTTLTNTNWPSWSNNDIINFALDLDNRKLYIGKNGTYINSGDPAAGSNHQITWANSTEISLILAGYSVSSGSGGGGDDTSWNYGNPAFSISSGNADANGYGNFEYAVPTGFYSLCTKNLAEYG